MSPQRSVSDRLAAAAEVSLIGRTEERRRLTTLLAPDGPAAVFVHGPGGIGKSALVNGTVAALPGTALMLDGREMEPTAPGAFRALGRALGCEMGAAEPASVGEVAEQMANAGVETLVIDHFERLNLLDGWIRNELIRAFPTKVTTVLVGRRGPNVAWRTAPGWRTLVGELEVGPMLDQDVDHLLAAHGILGDEAAQIRQFARGHPLAAIVAAEALVRRPGLTPGSGAPAEVVEELFTVLLNDLSARERSIAEAACVLRRTTLPLLAALLEEPDVEEPWQTLRALPFTVTTPAGIELSGLAAPVLLEALELRDPGRVRTLRMRAAGAILDSLRQTPDWSNTADLLHLVQNPVIRNAYTPPGFLQHAAEQARSEDEGQVIRIARRFTGDDSAQLAQMWWEVRRDAFSVVRAEDGGVAAFSVVAVVDEQLAARLRDPLVDAVAANLRDHPMPSGTVAVLFRWALGHRHGERPTPELATLIVDLKRTYLQLRARLRRVYTVVANWPTASRALRAMGFDVVADVFVGEQTFTLACLDFGIGGVDAWIGRHVLAEQAEPAAATKSPRDDGSAVFGLTAREREVLFLLAEGMTNAQLAKELFISERTANRHVSNIFGKLGVRNRTQATRAAVAAGLAG